MYLSNPFCEGGGLQNGKGSLGETGRANLNWFPTFFGFIRKQAGQEVVASPLSLRRSDGFTDQVRHVVLLHLTTSATQGLPSQPYLFSVLQEAGRDSQP